MTVLPRVIFPALLLVSGIPGLAQTDTPNAVPASTHTVGDIRDPVWYPGDTERLKPLVHKLAANVWLDQKDIWTSPFRMKKSDAKWWLGFGLVTGALIATDHDSSKVFENSPGQVRWGNRVSKAGAAYTLIPLVAGFYGYGVLRDDPKAREIGVLGTEALIDGLIVMQIVKTVTGRNRPDSTNDAGDFFSGGTSFPSGHTIESWSIASLLAHEYGRKSKVVPIVAYSLASIVSAARFAGQKHYASDIVLGAGMGWFIGRYVYQTHMDHAIHHSALLRPQVMPLMDPATRTYGISLAFGN